MPTTTSLLRIGSIAFLVAGTLGALPSCAAEPNEVTDEASSQAFALGVQATSDAKNAYYKISTTRTPTWVRLFLDTNQNAGSGFPMRGIGADVLIENGNIYTYAGSGGSWAWTYLKRVSASSVSGGVASVTVARADLGSPASLDLVAQADAATSAKMTQTFPGAPSPPASDPPPVGGSTTYAASAATIANPERGFYHQVDMTNPVGLAQLQGYRVNLGDSLMLAFFNMKNFVNGPLDPATLALYQQQLDTVRAAGLKAIVRFVYANTDTGLDATPQRMMAHMDQLAPLLANNKDVIATVQAGFIGSWGEWGNSVNFNSQQVASRKAITDKLLQVVPADRMLQVRTPTFKRTLYGTGALADAEAYTGTARARIGHHNDCFLASANDFGTYDNIADEYAYLGADTAFVPVGGETCRVNAPRSDCPTTVAEMAKFHWSFVHMDYHEDVVSRWKTQGCFDTIKQKIGYRFALVSGAFSTRGTPGGAFSVRFTVQNQGWSSPYNRRDVELVLRNTSTGALFRARLETDPRRWVAGQSTTVNETVALPANIPSGTYALLLNLPDPTPSLRARPEYAIQLANTDVWETASGFNDLNRTATIAP